MAIVLGGLRDDRGAPRRLWGLDVEGGAVRWRGGRGAAGQVEGVRAAMGAAMG